MTLIAGRDWSIGVNSQTLVNQAQLLGLIGRRLRTNYDSLVDEPIPDRLAALVRQLEEKTRHADGQARAARSPEVMASD